MSKMKKYTSIALFLLAFYHPFDDDMTKGADMLKEQKKIILHIKKTSATEGAEALSVVFPEVIRWSAFKNFFETEANIVLYVKKGREWSDFSIGQFQMKPSFIEELEKYVAEHEALKTFSYISISEKSEVESRKVRVYRMSQTDWQLRYAHVYWLAAKDVFKNRKFKTAKDRVHFFATAYNYGFQKPEKEIEAWEKRKCFPFGSKHKGEQVGFGDLAVEFFEKYSAEFEK
jgi:hypothetical protein